MTVKQQATKFLAELHDTKEPVLITEYGQPSAYLIDVEYYEMIKNRMKILEGLAHEETAIQEGRIYTLAEAKKLIKKVFATVERLKNLPKLGRKLRKFILEARN